MIYRSHRVALLAAATLGVTPTMHHVSAQTKAVSPLRAPTETVPQKLSPETQLPDAQFGAVRVDESRAAAFSDLISSQNIERQIKGLSGPLFFREGSLGFYDVSFEATGNRSDGQVRVTVTIVGQSDGETILARGQGVQQWQNSRWLIPTPIPQTQTPQSPPTPDVYPPIPAAPKATNARFFAPRLAFLAFCADSKRRQDDTSKAAKAERAREDARKSDEKSNQKPAPRSAPNPNPKHDADSKAASPPRSAPNPNPPSHSNDSKPSDKSNTSTRPRVYVPTFPAPRPQSSDDPRGNAPDPNPPIRDRESRPTSAPNPNPPSSGTSSIGPNPNPPNRGTATIEPYRPRRRRPVWNDPYGRSPYPYPYPVPYPYPYPVPVPNIPSTPNSGEGARQAFDYALLQARAQAEADFAWQLRGEGEPLDER